MTSPTYCILPFKSIYCELDKNDKDARLAPCCYYDFREEPRRWELSEFKEWWANGLTPLRQALLNGEKPAVCNKCWRDEENGIISYREQHNQSVCNNQQSAHVDEYPEIQMWALNNLCNLQCTYCVPWKSSTYTTNYYDNQETFKIYFNQNWSQKVQSHRDFSRFNEANDLMFYQMVRDASTVQFTGGEPFMISQYLEALKTIPNPTEVKVNITSNLTRLTDEWIDVLSRYPKAQVTASVDGIGQFAEYIRSPSKWVVIEKNIQRLIDAKIHVKIVSVWSRFSLKSFPDLLAWALEKNLSVNLQDLHWPEPLQIIGSTREEREEFLNKINPLLPETVDKWQYSGLAERFNLLLDQPYDHEINAAFQKWTTGLDILTGLKWNELSSKA